MLMNRSYNVLLRNEKSNNYNDFFEKQKNNTGAQCKIIDSISPAVMKPFNLFPVAREMLAIINTQYILYTYRRKSNIHSPSLTSTNTYNGIIIEIVDKLSHISSKMHSSRFQEPKCINNQMFVQCTLLIT